MTKKNLSVQRHSKSDKALLPERHFANSIHNAITVKSIFGFKKNKIKLLYIAIVTPIVII
ncbi:hypothetical protein M2326_000779 [Flavobacterium sp. 7A]|nr:hypothetical protein [Flavobacterium sp. 7A]